MKRFLIIALLVAMVTSMAMAKQPDLSFGGRFGGPAPETAEIIVAYNVAKTDAPVVSINVVQIYGAIGAGLQDDFGIVTLGIKTFPYPNDLRWLFMYVGATFGWSKDFMFPGEFGFKWDKDRAAIGPEFGVGLSLFDMTSGQVGNTTWLVLPEFSVGVSGVTGRVVGTFTIGVYP